MWQRWRRDLPEKLCAVCHEMFTPHRVNQLYCGKECRRRAIDRRAYRVIANRERMRVRRESPEFRKKKSDYDKSPERKAARAAADDRLAFARSVLRVVRLAAEDLLRK